MVKGFKWYLFGFLALFLCGSVIVFICADFSAKAEEPIMVVLDGEPLEFDVQPTIINDRVMVPMRVIFEALGASVQWDDATKTVTATKGDLIVKTTIGDKTMSINGIKIEIDVAPVIVANRTLVPVRFVSEAFGCEVVWDGELNTVYVYTDPYSDINDYKE